MIAVAPNFQVVRSEPRGIAYEQLLQAAHEYCDEVRLVRRHRGIGFGANAKLVLAKLKPFLIRQEDAKEWAGTKLLRGSAAIFSFHLTAPVIEVLQESANGVYSWTQPQLPEDLSFWTKNSTWFYSTTHEKECFFTLASSQLDHLRGRWPNVSALIS